MLSHHGSSPAAEVAAYQVSREFGMDLVPVTAHRKLGSIDGSIQVFLEGAEELNRIPGASRVISDRFQVFDYLIGNQDRFALNNVLKQGNREIAIDHGLAFRTGAGNPTVPEGGDLLLKARQDKDVLRVLNGRNESQWRTFLKSSGLNDDGVEEFLKRRKLVLD